MKQNLKIGFVALVVAGIAASGIALAQSDEPNGTVPPGDAPVERQFEGRKHGHHRGGARHLAQVAEILGMEPADIIEQFEAGSTLAEIAADNGSSGQELEDALLANLAEKLETAVADERITQEKADEILANATEKIDTLVNSTQEEIQAARQEQRAERRAEREARQAERQEILSNLLGMPFADIQAALQEGEQALADIAAEQGVGLTDLVSALVAPIAEDLDAKVAEGTITADQAAERLAQITEKVTERVQTVPGDGDFGRRGRGGRPGFGGGPGGGGPGGFGGFGGGDAPATTGAVLST